MLSPLRFWLGPLGLGLFGRSVTRRRFMVARGFFIGAVGRRVGRVDELGDAGLDRLVGRQLGLGVELEVASRPVKSVDDGLVAGLAVALCVEQVTE